MGWSDDRVEEIDMKDGELVFLNRGYARVPVHVSKESIRVGCHRITRKAWELLKRKIDGDK